MAKLRNSIDSKRMHYVLEVARAYSISTAAETLGITQSALSRSIADIEMELGVRLFNRLPRGVQLTPAGERFIAGARRLIDDIEAMVNHVREAHDLLAGRLRIGIAPSGYVDHASSALRTFAQAHPDVTVEVVTGTSQTLCPRLLNGDFDLIVGSSSYLQRWRELDIRHIAPLHFACMLRLEHPLLALGKNIREIDVLQYPIILPRSVEPGYSDIGQRFAHHGLPPLVPRYAIDDFTTILRLVRATDALYPLMYADSQKIELLKTHIALLTGVVEIPVHHISIAYAHARTRSAAAERFEELLATKLQKD